MKFSSHSRWILAIVIAGGAIFAPFSPTTVPVTPAHAAQDEPVPAFVRESIDKALAYLAKNQKPDGTFPQSDAAGTTAVPSLAVMAFMARGHVPGQGPYGDVLYRSIDYILASQQEDGLISRHQN